MNFGEAMTYVMKSKGQSILQVFWKEDLIRILLDIVSNGSRAFGGSRDRFKNISLKERPRNIVISGVEIIHISTVIPGRIKKAFTGFQKDMVSELEKRKDPKEKALFCLKIFGVLSSSTLSSFYQLPIPGNELRLGRVRIRSAFARFILAHLLISSLRAFLTRFLNEVEKELTEDADLVQVRYFRRLMDGELNDEEKLGANGEDPAFLMLDKFKHTIFNSDDESGN